MRRRVEDGIEGELEFLPAPEQHDLAILDGLITTAAESGSDEMDGPLVAGLLQFGPYFLDRLSARAASGVPVPEAEIVRAWTLFGAWLGGHLFTDDFRELEWRARAGLELWRRGGEIAQSFERMAAQCLLALPDGHPLRDRARVQAMIEASLERARTSGDQLEVLRCGGSLLSHLHLPWSQDAALIDEGLAILAARSSEAASETAEIETEWRMAAAFAISAEGQQRAQSSPADARPLFEQSLELYEPVMTSPPTDPKTAVTIVWRWGNLLMNAGYLPLAAATFESVRDLETAGADLWWHATYEGGLVKADMGDWPGARALLSGIQESLVINYAAWLSYTAEAGGLGSARLADMVEASAQRELCEGLGALALAEAAEDDWAQSFRHLDTTKALDYRQREALRQPLEPGPVPAARTAGHSGWMHGVPTTDADDERARLTAVLADQLEGATIEQVARSLAADQAVLSLGVGQGTWGMLVTADSADSPSGTFLRADVGYIRWLDLLMEQDVGELFRDSDDMSPFDDNLRRLLVKVDEIVAAPVADRLRQRGIRHVTVIPHGWLNLLPAAALPSFSDFAVSFAASARQVTTTPRAARIVRQALIVIDPVGDLPAAYAERAAIERHGLASRLALHSLTGPQATAAALSAAVREAGLLHVAGHATGNAMMPDEAGLLLAAGADSDGNPGPRGRVWSTAEIEAQAGALDSCGLAVLSACESGRGGIRLDSISDYSGLPPALLSLGASAVVATLWRIPDDLGALFADLFYERLAQATTADLPWLVHETQLVLRDLTGTEAAERLMSMRARVDNPMARLRIEAYALRLRKLGGGNPFAGPASWASFYHTGARYLHLPDEGPAS